MSIARICLGCPKITTGKNARCPSCAAAYQRRRGSSTQQGYGASWRRIRAAYLTDHPTCATCRAPATEVDHVTPRSMGGSDHPSNLQSLCHTCHSRKTATQSLGWGTPPRAAEDVRPQPSPKISGDFAPPGSGIL